jgi:hypothetical protein
MGIATLLIDLWWEVVVNILNRSRTIERLDNRI